MFAYRFLYKLVQSRIEVRGFLKLVRKLTELLCDCGVQHDVGTGNGQRRAGHTEFELVSGERERGGAVAVRGVLRKSRQNVNADLHDILFLGVVRLVLLDRLEDSFKLFADEHRNDGGRRFVRTETVIVSGSRNGYAEQLLIIIDRLDHGDEEQKELRVLVGSVAGLEQVYSGVCRDRPVVVLSGAVDPREGLFVKQACKTVTLCDLLHDLHRELVVIRRYVCGGEDRRKLMLCRRDLVVLGL